MSLDKLNTEQIYSDYYPKVMGYVCGKLGDRQDAEDIVSDVFLKIYDKLDSFDENKASLSTWIYHITKNTLTDYFRQRHITTDIPEDYADSFGIEDKLINDETLEKLADALSTLSERERNVILLHYYDGKSLKEISEAFGISYIYAKVVHKNALSALRSALK